ncbi:hypothetical protein H0A36_11900 [Endozoicomonas sp. SM1973]|uniref:Uncharacterized protein n=1 Tax=Spartinivicinus marinus TaxID=2994442 RepID=A0A853I9H6_9GAMM|nr:hypothetical protein [Spartinivicinus marinus]MCX4027588.1 hypothetical protein [Spartinivicinus marinus]NYZ66714.1 hypothetical protein [Spartinivicinus marinus]
MNHLANEKAPSFIFATLPIVITLLLMCCQILYFGDFTPHVSLIISYLQNGYSIKTSIAAVDQLLNRGGILSMAWVMTLILIALSFGAAQEKNRLFSNNTE